MNMVRYLQSEITDKFYLVQEKEIAKLILDGISRDYQLNLSDIPEILDSDLIIYHNRFYRSRKIKLPIDLDYDVLNKFESFGVGYQSYINEILRNTVKKRK